MKKENRKMAQERRAAEREKLEKQKKMKAGAAMIEKLQSIVAPAPV